MFVIKRDGSKQKMDTTQITERIKGVAQNLSVTPALITKKVEKSLVSQVKVSEIDEYCSSIAISMSSINPDYAILAARLSITNHHRMTPSTFTEYIDQMSTESTILCEPLIKFTAQHGEELNNRINDKNDLILSYTGFHMLKKSYLLKCNGLPIERYQYLLMRVSIGLHVSPTEEYKLNKEESSELLRNVLETYTLLSNQDYTHASPTLFNAGTKNGQYASCFLLNMKEDSMAGIYDTLSDCVRITKYAGGIGLAVSDLRSTGAYIKGTNGTASGLIPLMSVFNSAMRHIDQGGGKRKGTCAIYIEPWHADIEEFISLRKNTGAEEARCRDLFLAIWVPDLFMEKVVADEDWYLFSSDEAPGLNNVYGKEFNELYEKYVKDKVYKKVIKARSLMKEIARAQIETGNPYFLYKDKCNEYSNQKNLGVIKSSNLCAEIIEYTDETEIAACNLASINLVSYIKKQENEYFFLDLLTNKNRPSSYAQFYDFERLHSVVKIITRNLNNVIDFTFYPLNRISVTNKDNRPLGIGVQGLSKLFMKLKIPFESIQAFELNKFIFETIYHAALESSIDIAREKGTYKNFKGSPYSEGKLHFEYYGVKCDRYNWDKIREDLKTFGCRNSLLIALMPTAATAHILQNTESFEPINSNYYVNRQFAGDFISVNPLLLNDCIKLGIWNDKIKERLIKDEGSVLKIKEISDGLKEVYKTIWEIPQKVLIQMTADRQPFVDQSQSLNIFLANPSIKKVVSMHIYGWRKGLKTGSYYLRTKAATEAVKFTLKRMKSTEAGKIEDPVDSICLSCSA